MFLQIQDSGANVKPLEAGPGIPRLFFGKGGLVVCEPCIAFTLFSNARISKDEAPPNLLGPYGVFMEDFLAQVGWCRTSGNQMHPSKVTQSELAVLPNWLADPKRRVRDAVGEFYGGKVRGEWRTPALELRAGPTYAEFFVRISLPLTWLKEKGPTGVEEYLRRLLDGGFPLHSGYVGLGFAWDHASPAVHDELEPVFFELLQRHPGLVSTSPLSQSLVARFGLVDIGWITLLGSELCAKMGGQEDLRKRCATIDVAKAQLLPGQGLMIRLGEGPRLGDAEAGDTLEEYRALGKLLSPLRDPSRLERKLVIAGFGVHAPDDEPRKKWIHRFF
jgi:hypothetical protein